MKRERKDPAHGGLCRWGRKDLSGLISSAVAAVGLSILPCQTAWASWQSDVAGNAASMISIIDTIFQVVGVILTAFAVGQLVLAFKNEDADSKARATTMIVVGLVLIALPTVLKGLKLWNNIFTLTDDTVEGFW